MEPFSGQAVGNALYGFLQGMSSDKREVLQATIISCVGGSGAIVSGAVECSSEAHSSGVIIKSSKR